MGGMMPYKDKEKRKQVNKDSQRKRRGDTEGVTGQGVTVPACYVQGITGKFKSLPERPRYLELSDGQVLDRLNQPEPVIKNDVVLRMAYCNESNYNFKPLVSSKERVKELLKGIK